MFKINETIALLRQMVAIPSSHENEEELALFVANFLKDIGLNVNIQQLGPKRCNVIGRCVSNTKSKRLLLLGGHLDTVTPSELWRTDPYQLSEDGDKLYGLGAGDMKGGLAAQLCVIKALRDEDAKIDADIEFVALADEERYSIGAHEFVSYASDLRTYDEAFFIFAEPHFDNIAIGATGKVMLKCIVTGCSGHAATPETGINAIDCMAAFITAVNQQYNALYARGNVGSHCCIKLDSCYKGYSLNIPEVCECLINKQLLPSEDIEEIIKQLHYIYDENVGVGKINITQELPCYPSYNISPDHKILSMLLNILKQHGREPELRINNSVSDGNIIYPKLGIPGVLYGPIGVNIHREGEYTTASSLYEYMNELYTFITTYYGVG